MLDEIWDHTDFGIFAETCRTDRSKRWRRPFRRAGARFRFFFFIASIIDTRSLNISDFRDRVYIVGCRLFGGDFLQARQCIISRELCQVLAAQRLHGACCRRWTASRVQA